MSQSQSTQVTTANGAQTDQNNLNGNLIPTLDGDDFIVGTDEDETLAGGKGADQLYAQGGADQLYGGDGPDILDGGEGADNLYGNDGKDWLDGGRGNDRLFGGADDDLLVGDKGNDTLYGNLGNDNLWGNDGQDRMDGGSGHDELHGGGENDVLTGGPGRDLFCWGAEDYDGIDQVMDFNPNEDALLLAGLIPDGGDSSQALSRLALRPAAATATWLLVFNEDRTEEIHRISLARNGLLNGSCSEDQMLRQLLEQHILQLV